MVDEGHEENRIAMKLLESQNLLIPVTALLEAEWVLRSVYGASRAVIGALFSNLLGAANLVIQDYDAVAEALTAHSAGMDFADALHIFRSIDCEAFLTFDKPLIRASQRIPVPLPVVRPA